MWRNIEHRMQGSGALERSGEVLGSSQSAVTERKEPLSAGCIWPEKPRYQGIMVSGSSPCIMRFRLATISRGLYIGTDDDQPVPIPSEPLTRTMGRIGT